MKVIYEPKGKAREYSPLAVNLYKGCGHMCDYCYAPAALRMSREDFHVPVPRSNIIKNIEADAKTLSEKNCRDPILLCFTCDPYQPIDSDYRLTRRVIEILHSHNLKVRILTKGGYRSKRDFDLLSWRPDLSEYGTTLVFNDEEQRRIHEPEASPTSDRIKALKIAHSLGIPTWVSFEPVFDPKSVYQMIDETYEFVDRYSVGKLNHNKEVEDKVDWSLFHRKVTGLLDLYGKEYYIKNDLGRYNSR
ncbi:MAG: radical SAM protein [Halobacteriota archaeon]|nr:radical SAM protein [Halobacteriota archaeon]